MWAHGRAGEEQGVKWVYVGGGWVGWWQAWLVASHKEQQFVCNVSTTSEQSVSAKPLHHYVALSPT